MKIPDTTHWDGGIWQPPASFDALCETYTPPECGECGTMACPRALQMIARQFHPSICDAIKSCNGLCDNQCPTSAETLLGYVDGALAESTAAVGVKASVTLSGPPTIACTGGNCLPAMQQQEQRRE